MIYKIGFVTKEPKHVAGMYDVFNIKYKHVKVRSFWLDIYKIEVSVIWTQEQILFNLERLMHEIFPKYAILF
jgi:hypothetical protein